MAIHESRLDTRRERPYPYIRYPSVACERVKKLTMLACSMLNYKRRSNNPSLKRPGHLLIVIDVEKRLSWALCGLPGQVWHEVVAIKVDLVGHVAVLIPREQFVS